MKRRFAKYSRCPFDRGHTADRVDRGNALRKCTASTKAALYRVPFRASRISQGKVSSKNKEMFCESNTIGPSNIPGIPLNGAKKHYTVLPFLECVCCFWYPPSPFLSRTIEGDRTAFQNFPTSGNLFVPPFDSPSTINRTNVTFITFKLNIFHID